MPDLKSAGRERFFEVAADQASVRILEGDEGYKPTPQEQLWREFHDWARSTETQAWLDICVARKVAYRVLENQHLDSHAKLAYYKAHRDLCEYLEEEIRAWAADTPPRGPA